MLLVLIMIKRGAENPEDAHVTKRLLAFAYQGPHERQMERVNGNKEEGNGLKKNGERG